MSHGIKKETYVDADEKTTKALTFDLLDNLYRQMDKMTNGHDSHVEVCSVRFTKIERKRKKDTAIASASGFGGGFVAMSAYYIKEWLTK